MCTLHSADMQCMMHISLHLLIKASDVSDGQHIRNATVPSPSGWAGPREN